MLRVARPSLRVARCTSAAPRCVQTNRKSFPAGSLFVLVNIPVSHTAPRHLNPNECRPAGCRTTPRPCPRCQRPWLYARRSLRCRLGGRAHVPSRAHGERRATPCGCPQARRRRCAERGAVVGARRRACATRPPHGVQAVHEFSWPYQTLARAAAYNRVRACVRPARTAHRARFRRRRRRAPSRSSMTGGGTARPRESRGAHRCSRRSCEGRNGTSSTRTRRR
jgi:hypothetical protein